MTLFALGTIVLESIVVDDAGRHLVWIVQADETASISLELLDDERATYLEVEDGYVTLSAANGRVVYRIVGDEPPYPKSVIVERLTPWPIS